jgi:glucose/arabinose dehydrogenase
MRKLSICVVLAGLLAGCGNKAASGPGRREEGKPVETKAPNAPQQQPAFVGQTRAPYRSTPVRFDTRVIAKGLEHPWAVAILPDGRFLITERPGRLRIAERDGTLSPPITGVPKVDARGQGGLLDVVLDPEFPKNQTIFFSYSEPREGGNGTAVARARLAGDRLEDVEVIWRMTPTLESTMHFGSRIVVARDGNLYITTGERSIDEGRHQSQKLDSAFGKIIRIARDGSIPKDNPFAGRKDALPEIWSYGHRNIQSAALHPETGQLWVVDHGARGGDEINAVEPGKNYGWPIITYGIEYKGDKVGAGITTKPGMEQPLYYWDPVIAPSGMAFYAGNAFPQWQGSLFVGALAGKHVARLTVEGRRVIGEERLLADRARIRDVRVGPDGTLYVLTDEDNGELLQLVPAESKPSETVSERR